MNRFASESRSIMQVRTALFGLVCCLFLSACEASKADLTWVEPVKLASGETVKIKRHVVMIHERAWGGGFSSAPIYRTSSIELEPASPEFPKWDAPFVPIVMDKDPANGEWLIVASISSCSLWLRNGLPRPPYWAFRLRNGEWYRSTVPDSFIERSANLFVEFDVTDSSGALNRDIQGRKRKQEITPKHALRYSKIDSKFETRCGGNARASEPVGRNELDLKKFRSAP